MVTDLGAQVVKGLPAPLRVYRVQGDRRGRAFARRVGAGSPHAAGRTGSGSRPAPRPLGARQGWTRARGAAQRRARDRQVAPGPGLEGSHRGGGVPQLGMSLLSLPPGQRPLSADRPLRAHAPVRSRRRACRAAREARGRTRPIRLGPARGGVALGRAPVPAGSRCSTRHWTSRLNARRRRRSRPSWRCCLALAAEHPLLFIVEDLHWADPSTRELVDFVFGQVPAASILMLMTSRPEFRPPWGQRSHLTHLTVNRVTRKQTELMVERVTRGKPLPAEVLQHVVAKTDGVPLFVEELTRMVLESDLLRDQGDRYELDRVRCRRWPFPRRFRTRSWPGSTAWPPSRRSRRSARRSGARFTTSSCAPSHLSTTRRFARPLPSSASPICSISAACLPMPRISSSTR